MGRSNGDRERYERRVLLGIKLAVGVAVGVALVMAWVARSSGAEKTDAAAESKPVVTVAREAGDIPGRRGSVRTADVPSDAPGRFATTWTEMKVLYRVEPAKP